MDDLNLSGTEQRVQDFQLRLRVDYAAKIQEVATLQTRLLNVEHENNVLRQQLLIAKNENEELKKGVTANEEYKPLGLSAALASEDFKPWPKRERSPSLEIIVPQSSFKKFKGNSDEGKEPTTAVDSHNQSFSSFSHSVDTASVFPNSQQVEVEIFENVFSLPKSITDTYLRGVETLNIYPATINVTSEFLEVHYGLKLQTHPTHVTKLDPSLPHTRRLFLSPLSVNPSMPSFPGDPGLLFAPWHDLTSQSPWTLFCKQSETEDVWSYQGEYENELIGMVTAEGFNMQSPTVKREWAQRLLNVKISAKYRAIRARIALRLASVIPIDDKEKEAGLIKNEANRIGSRRGRPVSEDDIITAFSNGEEGVDIVRMKFVKYDHIYANEMEIRCTSYVDLQEALRNNSMQEGGPPSPSLSMLTELTAQSIDLNEEQRN